MTSNSLYGYHHRFLWCYRGIIEHSLEDEISIGKIIKVHNRLKHELNIFTCRPSHINHIVWWNHACVGRKHRIVLYLFPPNKPSPSIAQTQGKETSPRNDSQLRNSPRLPLPRRSCTQRLSHPRIDNQSSCSYWSHIFRFEGCDVCLSLAMIEKGGWDCDWYTF